MNRIASHWIFAAAALPFAFAIVAAPTRGNAQAMEHHEHKPAVPSTSLTVSAAGKTLQLTPAELAAMPQRSLTVENDHSHAQETYTGVGLNELLAKASISTEGTAMKTLLHSYVRAEGTDHYFVIYSTAELEQSLRTDDAIVALTVNGKPLTDDGAFKLVNGGEKKPARWVRNLISLQVVTVD